jgi:hypothetical protein
MKTNFRVWLLGGVLTASVSTVGCQENQANAHAPLVVAQGPVYSVATVPDDAVPAVPVEAPVPVVKNEALPAPAVPPAAPAPNLVAAPANSPSAAPVATPAPAAPPAVPSEPPKISPALAEVVRLIQANVSPDVVLAYITNSSQPFFIGASEIVYLHDLGAPGAIVTSLINMDSTPEMQARKQAAIAVKPLPPGVALNQPAPNIYPVRTAVTPPQNPPAPVPVERGANDGATYLSPPPSDTTVTYNYPQPAAEVNYSYFYDSLSPYGTWSDVPGYGSCWRPTCATWNSSWRPYADGGRWLWSDNGWYWYSDYSWGWAPFHYGRWCQPAGYGWVWQPDTCWGPSWVSWRYSPNYCGWAPLPPSAHYVSGLGFYYNSGSVGIGFEFGLTAADYCYIPSSRFCDPHPRNFCLPPHQNVAIHKDTTVINNYIVGNNNRIVNQGVGLDKIARVTRGDIKRVALKETSSVKNLGTRHDRLESDGSTLTVYRPPASTLARKSVAVSGTQPSVSVSRPPSFVRPAAAPRSVSGNAPAPASVAPSSAASVKAYAPAVNSRTTPTPVTLYNRPVSAANEPVIVTGGIAPSLPVATPEGSRNRPGAVSGVEGSKNFPGHSSQPATASDSGARVSSVFPANDSARSASAHKPAAVTTAPAGGNNALAAKSGYARMDPAAAAAHAAPVPQRPPVANVAPAGYTRPSAVAPSHNPNYAAPSSGYVAPAHTETHHSQVAAPPAAVHSGGASAPSGSSGGSHSRPADSSGDGKKGR